MQINFFSSANNLISKHVSLVVFSGILTGLCTDMFGKVSQPALSWILFIELFIACFKIRKEDIKEIEPKTALVFILSRYLILPACSFYLGTLISAEAGIAMLLLTLLPAGVTSPAFAGIFNANIALVLAVVLITGLGSPFYVPLMIQQLAGADFEISSAKMMKTILLLVVCPMLLHIPFRKIKKFNAAMINYNALLIIPLVWITVVVPVSRYRHYLFEDLSKSAVILLAFLLVYFFYCLFGLLFSIKKNSNIKKSYIIGSGIHNITLGVVLSMIYFPATVSFLVICANISCIIMISFLRIMLKKI